MPCRSATILRRPQPRARGCLKVKSFLDFRVGPSTKIGWVTFAPSPVWALRAPHGPAHGRFAHVCYGRFAPVRRALHARSCAHYRSRTLCALRVPTSKRDASSAPVRGTSHTIVNPLSVEARLVERLAHVRVVVRRLARSVSSVASPPAPPPPPAVEPPSASGRGGEAAAARARRRRTLTRVASAARFTRSEDGIETLKRHLYTTNEARLRKHAAIGAGTREIWPGENA